MSPKSSCPRLEQFSSGLSTASLQRSPAGERISRILAAALQAVDPAAAVRRHLKRQGNMLEAGERTYDLERHARVWLVGAGKAGEPMALAAAEILGDNLAGGRVIVKDGHVSEAHRPENLVIFPASHPVPDERGVQATRQITSLLKETHPDDLVVCLISGGGSALLVDPAPGVDLEQIQQLTRALLASGATIEEINTLRKHLDQVKGGGLARLASPSPLVAMILSDVVGDALDVIASGPTIPDPTTFADAYRVLEKHQLLDQVPRGIQAYLQHGLGDEVPDTPKPGNALFENVHNVLVGSNALAAHAALETASVEGFNALLLTTFLQGEARHIGRVLAALARQVDTSGEPLPRPACLILGGETTVTLGGDGLGGRNQEIALGATPDLAGLVDVILVTLATDGGDGPTDAAGAVVTGETLSHALKLGLAPADYLARNDSYSFFAALEDLLKPGPTRTNVNDLAFIFAL